MSERQCNRCGATKSAEQMCVRGGKPSSICRDCFAASFQEGAKKTRKVKTIAEIVERRTSPKTVKLNGQLEVEQTYGFRAAWEDGYLAIEQDQQDEDGEAVTARLLLTKADVARIAEWVQS